MLLLHITLLTTILEWPNFFLSRIPRRLFFFICCFHSTFLYSCRIFGIPVHVVLKEYYNCFKAWFFLSNFFKKKFYGHQKKKDHIRGTIPQLMFCIKTVYDFRLQKLLANFQKNCNEKSISITGAIRFLLARDKFMTSAKVIIDC